MTRILEQFSDDHEHVLDKLVDGELTEHERRELLSALDDEPAGWRRCALAFLEAQSWRGDLRIASKSTESVPMASQVAPAADAKSNAWSVSRFAELCLAIAASVMLAFGAGMWARGIWNPLSTPGDSTPLASQASTDSQIASSLPANLPIQTVKLNVSDPGNESSAGIDLPVVETLNLTEDWLRNQRSAMSPDMIRALERAGHRVTKQQQYYPIRMQDGRQLVVPVEQVDVVPQTRPAY